MRALPWQRYCGTGVSTVLLSGCSASGLAHIALPGAQGALAQVPWRRLELVSSGMPGTDLGPPLRRVG